MRFAIVMSVDRGRKRCWNRASLRRSSNQRSSRWRVVSSDTRSLCCSTVQILHATVSTGMMHDVSTVPCNGNVACPRGPLQLLSAIVPCLFLKFGQNLVGHEPSDLLSGRRLPSSGWELDVTSTPCLWFRSWRLKLLCGAKCTRTIPY